MASVFRSFLEKLSGSVVGTFIGDKGDLFYDPDAATPTIKISDGVTPGGRDISSASGGVQTEIEQGNSKVEVTDTGTDGTITLKTENLDRWKVTTGGHILPSANDAYDIGSAEFKIRDLYVSESSLWVGDDHKVEVSGGKMKFKKRKKSTVPTVISDGSGGDDEAGVKEANGLAAETAITDITLHHWLTYAKTLDGIGLGVTATVGSIWPPESAGNYDASDYDAVDTTGDRGGKAPEDNPTGKVDVDLFITKSAIITNPVGSKQFDFISPFIEEGASFEATCHVLNPNSQPIPTFTIMGAAAGTQQISGTPDLTASINTYKVSAIVANGLWHMSVRCYPHV